jgi:hypothetical protein
MLVVSGFVDTDDRFVPDYPVQFSRRTRVRLTVEEDTAALFARQTAAIEESIRLLRESENEVLPADFPNRIQWFHAPEDTGL